MADPAKHERKEGVCPNLVMEDPTKHESKEFVPNLVMEDPTKHRSKEFVQAWLWGIQPNTRVRSMSKLGYGGSNQI